MRRWQSGIKSGGGDGRWAGPESRTGRRARRALAVLVSPVMALGGGVLPVASAVGGAAALTVASVAASSAPARASTTCTGSVLVFPNSVNGGSSSAEAAEATALGCTVTMFSATALSGMTQAQMIAYFGGFTAILIGDPSTSSTCSSTVPADALTYAADWGPAVDGNVSVLGTAPVLAGSAGATLLDDGITWTVSGPSADTGLYVSLNCEYRSVSAGTAVPLLAGVAGGGFAVTGRGTSCPSNSGSVNASQALADSPFMGLAGTTIGPWSSPACAMQETFNTWSGGVTGLAYDAGATPASFTASDATTGQPFILSGTVVPATLALSPSTGGQSPPGAAFGASNGAAPGVAADTAGDPVDTENGDFTQSNTDLSIPTFGPSLDFTRSYDAVLARQETVAGTPVQVGAPGSMGFGWTDNWDSSLVTGEPVPGEVYTIDGTRSDNGNGGSPTGVPIQQPGAIVIVGGNTYIADSSQNRILEVPGTGGTQFGIPMTGGDTYVIAGSPAGVAGRSTNGTSISSSLLNAPEGVAVDGSGNLYIADTGNNRVLEVPVVSGQNRGFGTMTVNDIYTIAGHGSGAPGHTGNGGEADDAFLDQPWGVSTGHANADIYIADSENSRIQEVPAAAGTQWNQSMTAFDIYTVAGSAAGTAGTSGDGGAAASALLNGPDSISFSSAGDLYIADTGNNRIQEVPVASGAQWGITPSFTQWDMYTVAGSPTGSSGHSANGTVDTSSLLNQPNAVTADNGTQLYITDLGDNRIEELARSLHTEWGISMAPNAIYTIAGTGSQGFSGDGGLSTSAKLNSPLGLALDGSFNLFVADSGNNRIREVSASTSDISEYAGNGKSLTTVGNGAPATTAGLNQPRGSAADAQGDIFIADAGNNRVQEVAASNHTQFGISMAAGAVYTVAGSADGASGLSGDGGAATSALLDNPLSVAVDASGDLFIDDANNNRIQEVPGVTGGGKTAGDMYTVAGSATGAAGISGDGGAATSALLDVPFGIAVDSQGDLFIADQTNNRVQEVPATTGGGKTAGDMYTVAGSATGVSGSTGDGGAATSAKLQNPSGVTVDAAGDLYISDSANERVQEVPATTGTHWAQLMTAGDMYTIAGTAGSTGATGDDGPASAALLDFPADVAIDSSGDLYIADSFNNRVQELAGGNGTQWGQAMTAGDIYTVAGSSAGAFGSGGEGGPSTSALFGFLYDVAVDPSGDLFLADQVNNDVDEAVAAIGSPFGVSPAAGGVTVNQADGSQVTFYPKSGSTCTAPYVAAGSGGYCTLPENVSATLSFSSGGGGIYTYSPGPGDTFTYGSAGPVTSETDAAGDSLSITYASPAPGAGNCPATAHWCETVTSASGRALTIGYNSSNLVTSVTDPMGREWTYAYSGSDLTSATDPLGNKTSYTFGAGSTGNPQLANDLLTITQPNAQPGGPDAGDDTVNVYDQFGRVTSQADPMGNVTSFNYCVSASDGDCMNTATGTGSTTVIDPDGNTTVDDYSLGSLVGQADLSGGTALTSSQAFAPDQSSTGTSADTQLDTAEVDGNGNVTTTAYDSNGNPTSATGPDGVGTQTATTTEASVALNESNCSSTAEATTTCAASPGPSPVAAGGIISPPSSAPPQGLTWTLYDHDGNELYSTTGVYPPGGVTASYSRTTYALYSGNSITLGASHITCGATPPSASLPCAAINADGVVTQLAYNSQGDLTSMSTPDGNGTELATTTYGYDSDGEQTSQTAPDGNLTGANAGNYTTVTAFSNDGDQITVSQGDGSGHTVTARVTHFGYDADGNQTTDESARGFTTTTTYNADDNATVVTDPDGNATLTCYDGDGNVAQTVPPVGVAANTLTSGSCPTSYPADYGDRLAADATTYTFDAQGNQTAMTTPAPAGLTGFETTSYTYDGNGNILTTTAPPTSVGGSAQVTTSHYNGADELSSVTTGSGTSAAATTSSCYDPNGDETSAVYADGNTSGIAACETASPWVISSSPHPTQAAYQTTYGYDSVGEQVSTTTPATTAAPAGATTTSAYDAAGNRLTSADPNGVTTTQTFTPLNQLATISYSGSSAHSVSYTYDANGSKTAMIDATGSSSYSYDSFGELTSATNGASQNTGYGYNADGEVDSITYPLPATATWATSDTVSYTVDNADLYLSATDFNGNRISIGDTADGLPDSLALGTTGDLIDTTYDNTDVSSLIKLKNSTTTLQSFTYSDAPAGNILTETDTPSSSLSPAVYTYDAKGRVTSMTPGSNSTLNYAFDASSSPTTLPSGADASSGYDKDEELVSSTLAGTTTTYSYDADGQRLSEHQGTSTLASGAWNGAGELTAYSDAAGSMTGLTYDGDAIRTASTTGAATQQYTWNAVAATPQLIMDSARAYIYAGGTAPAEQVGLSSGTITYLVADGLGSVRGAVNSSGSLAGTTSYDAWGNPLTTGGLTATTPFGFAGGFTDPSGLIYLDHRYYDPATAQFVSVDPDLSDTLASYSYAEDDPIDNVDPTGLDTERVPDKYDCSIEVDRAHYATKSGYPANTAVKAKVGIVGCTAKPEHAIINVHLNKVGEFTDYWQASGRCDSNHPGKTDCKWVKGKKAGTYQFWNLHTIKVCKKESGVNSTFYGEGNVKVEEEGVDYWAPAGAPTAYYGGPRWTADNCWTNSPLHPPS